MARILCIDDEKDIREDVAEVVQEAGYEVIEAGNGQEGLEIILSEHPDLVLCDINMPGLNGFRLLTEIQNKHPECRDIPFLFLTANTNRDDILNGLGLGADDYITKPIDHELLILKIMSSLRIPEEYKERIRTIKSTDTVTGLPNRMKSLEFLFDAMIDIHKADNSITAISLTLEDFKGTVERYGRGGSEKILLEVALRLQSCAQEGDFVGNLGGEDFLFIFQGGAPYSETVARRIQKALTPNFMVDGRETSLKITMGLASYPGSVDDPYTLMQYADLALQQARSQGLYCMSFTPEFNWRAEQRRDVATFFDGAMSRGELALNFQPLVDSGSGKIIGAEALLRWNNAELGNVPPDQFIPIAEESGLIMEIGKWVLENACLQAREWQSLHGVPYRIAVNVSATEFTHGQIIKEVSNALQKSGLAPDCLEIEVTEGMLLKDSDNILDILTTLKKIGVRLSIDDFGTGYSSLSYLKKFPFDTLKIDRSFVSEIEAGASNAELCSTIIHMAHTLDLEVIGEGVENETQMEFLGREGCDLFQGYFLGKPMPGAEFISMLKNLDDELDFLQDGSITQDHCSGLI